MEEATPSLPHTPLWHAHEEPYIPLNLSQETMPASPPLAHFSYGPTYQIASTFGSGFYSKNDDIRKRSLPEHGKSALLTSYCSPSRQDASPSNGQ